MSITTLKTKSGYASWVDNVVFTDKDRLKSMWKAIRYKYGKKTL